MTQLEKCFLLNVGFYIKNLEDLLTLSYVNKKCNLFDMFLKNPPFSTHEEIKKSILLMKNIQTVEASMEILSQLHTEFNGLSFIRNFITNIQELDYNVYHYLKFIQSRIVELSIVIDQKCSFNFQQFISLRKLHINISTTVEEIELDFSQLSRNCLVIIETIESFIPSILPFIKTIKGDIIIKAVDKLNEITVGMCKSIRKDIRFLCQRNNLYMSISKEIVLLQPLRYHLCFSAETITSDWFSKEFDKYDIPFITIFPPLFDYDDLLIDLSGKEIYSLVFPPFQFPKIQLTVPTQLLSLTIESPSIEIPLLPNLFNLCLINVNCNILPELPHSLTGLTIVSCDHLKKVQPPPYLINLCLRDLPSLKKITSIPQTVEVCYIDECPVDIPIIQNAFDIHCTNCKSLQSFPQSLERLYLENIQSKIPEISSLTNLRDSMFYEITQELSLPTCVKKVTCKNCPKIQFPSFLKYLSIPHADGIDYILPEVEHLLYFGHSIISLPSTLTSLNLNGCVIEEHSILPSLDYLVELTLTHCVIKTSFPSMTQLTYLDCSKTSNIPLVDSIKELHLTNIPLENITIPSSITYLKLFNMRSLVTIIFNTLSENDNNIENERNNNSEISNLQSIEIKRCHLLQSLQFPTTLTNLNIIDSPHCIPLNISQLQLLPFGQQLYFSSQSSQLLDCQYFLP